MNAEDFAKLIAEVVLDDYAPQVIDNFQATTLSKPERWDAPIIELIQRSSPAELEALRALVKWVASDTSSLILSVIDPASGDENSGAVTLRSEADGASLPFVSAAFDAEARKRGIS